VSSATYFPIWLRWLRHDLATLACTFSQQPHNGYHGFEHSVFVGTGRDTAGNEIGPQPPTRYGRRFVARCWPVRRRSRARACRARGRYCRLVLEPWLGHWLDESVRNGVVDAIRDHAGYGTAVGDIAACLQDADRLRLAWERGYEPRYFTTATGAMLAQRTPLYLKNLLTSLGGERLTEIKFEVTDQCNLACTFCHQDFGHAAGHQVLGPHRLPPPPDSSP
jgi:hypothetical protein